MKDEEKKLIENLFDRLKKTELNSCERDESANDLIQILVKKQPFSCYYMAQTILIQETAIKKMSIHIDELKKRIDVLNAQASNKKPSFLSNFFKTDSDDKKSSHDSNIWKKKENILPSQNYHSNISSPITQTLPTQTATRNSGFLSNALQTATGVAGGMILGNMLMNVFNHSKPEEEIFDTIHTSPIEKQDIPISLSDNNHHNLVNYEEDSNSIDTDHSSHVDTLNYMETNDIDQIDDDNFI